MKAVIWTRYGAPEVLEIREVEKPSPMDNEVLVRIHATTVTAGDCELRSLNLPFFMGLVMRLFWIGFSKPKEGTIPGTELAGEIEAVGTDVNRLKVGEKVFGAAGMRFGANAEHICLPENPVGMEGGVAVMPANMTYEEAATVPFGGRDSLHFIRLGNLKPGQTILINGAGGSIGTYAVQLAKHYGAEVTAVDSAPKHDMLRAIGADHVIDYTQEDFTENGEVYDVIFDVVGTISFSRCRRSIREDGTFLLANPARQMLGALWMRMTSKTKVILQTASGTLADLRFLRRLIEEGKLKAVVDRTFPLEQIVEAHRYVEGGGKLGNVVITMEGGDK